MNELDGGVGEMWSPGHGDSGAEVPQGQNAVLPSTPAPLSGFPAHVLSTEVSAPALELRWWQNTMDPDWPWGPPFPGALAQGVLTSPGGLSFLGCYWPPASCRNL
jgi:hypothetical protein